MSAEWEVALICPIHKKGSKLQCKNFRGISLLNICYKVLTRIITDRLQDYFEETLGDYQCGFRRNRSTTDHIFTISCILEKCYEYNLPVHQLYVDYLMAYDSVDRAFLYETLDLAEIPKKMSRLVKMTLRNAKSKVKVQSQCSREFVVRRGLRQRDPLSRNLFNLSLD